MLSTEQVFQAIQSLPVPDQLLLVERVVHELARTVQPAAPRRKLSPIGWLADDPEAADAILRSGTEGRAADRMRKFGEDEDAG